MATRSTLGFKGLFTSIASAELRKVVFLANPIYDLATVSTAKSSWARIDIHLCGIVDRLGRAGYRHTLQVKFRPHMDGDGRKHDLCKFLPEFGTRGVVTVTDPVPDNWPIRC